METTNRPRPKPTKFTGPTITPKKPQPDPTPDEEEDTCRIIQRTKPKAKPTHAKKRTAKKSVKPKPESPWKDDGAADGKSKPARTAERRKESRSSTKKSAANKSNKSRKDNKFHSITVGAGNNQRFTEKRWESFCDYLIKFDGCVADACRAEQVDRATVFEHTRKYDKFRKMFDKALTKGLETFKEVATKSKNAIILEELKNLFADGKRDTREALSYIRLLNESLGITKNSVNQSINIDGTPIDPEDDGEDLPWYKRITIEPVSTKPVKERIVQEEAVQAERLEALQNIEENDKPTNDDSYYDTEPAE